MYHILYAFLYLLSLLPLRLLYLISDLLFFLSFSLLSYRKDVVMANLRIAFPDRPETERKKIAKRFYRNLTDTLAETIKFITWDRAEFDRHFSCDLSGLHVALKEKKTVYLIGMHNFNWEFANWGLVNKMPLPFLGIYMPLANKHLNKIILDMRSRFGTIMIPAVTFRESYATYRNIPHVLATVADQSPGDPSQAYWLHFFKHPTGFIKGTEKGARANNASVVFAHFYKKKRGHYHLDTKFITNDIHAWKEGELTIQYAQYIESCLQQHPDNYLWSHRRWKHAWKESYGPLINS